MKNVKQAYYYVFYILYKRRQKSENILSSDFIASLYIIILEIWTIGSFINYYDIIFCTNIGILSNKAWVVIVILLVAFDYILLHHKDQWKHIIDEFDKLPDKKNKRNKKIVYVTIMLMIINFILSFYLLFMQAKHNQTGPYAPEFIAKERREDSLQKAQQIEKLKKIYGEDKR